MSAYYETDPKAGALRVWGSDIDAGTIVQASKTARLPILGGPVALMPDAHVGLGSTVGSVIPTDGAIIPSAVGVDIGCGMIAVETSLTASQLPDDLTPFLASLEKVVPAGVGAGHSAATKQADLWFKANPFGWERTDSALAKTARTQFGSLGSGNHFFEVCLDETDAVWLVLHSGSRGVGNKLAQGHIKIAKTKAIEDGLRLEDPDLAYFTQGTDEFYSYMRDLNWAQSYAAGNREAMMDAALYQFFWFTGAGPTVRQRINCHHNYTERESFTIDGETKTLWITRKGAIRAQSGDLGIIPGSMGTGSYIVRGLGNTLSYNSCSHGAGRKMSRSKAKAAYTTADLEAAMAGKTWLSGKASALVDEIPQSYKDIEQIMKDQDDLVEIVHTLTQILNYKGTK